MMCASAINSTICCCSTAGGFKLYIPLPLISGPLNLEVENNQKISADYFSEFFSEVDVLQSLMILPYYQVFHATFLSETVKINLEINDFQLGAEDYGSKYIYCPKPKVCYPLVWSRPLVWSILQLSKNHTKGSGQYRSGNFEICKSQLSKFKVRLTRGIKFQPFLQNRIKLQRQEPKMRPLVNG